jgi:hypothetical protein
MFEDKLKNNEERNHGRKRTKKKEFILGILFDAVGMLSLLVPCFMSQMSFGHRWQHI